MHIIDFSVAEARDAWLGDAVQASSHDYVDGLFIDKALDTLVHFDGVPPARMATW